MKHILGWLCFRSVMVLPVNLKSRLYRWALAWAGWYAHRPAPVENDDTPPTTPEDAEGLLLMVDLYAAVILALLVVTALAFAPHL